MDPMVTEHAQSNLSLTPCFLVTVGIHGENITDTIELLAASFHCSHGVPGCTAEKPPPMVSPSPLIRHIAALDVSSKEVNILNDTQ